MPGNANTSTMNEPMLSVPYTPTIDLTRTLQPWSLETNSHKANQTPGRHSAVKERMKVNRKSKNWLPHLFAKCKRETSSELVRKSIWRRTQINHNNYKKKTYTQTNESTTKPRINSKRATGRNRSKNKEKEKVNKCKETRTPNNTKQMKKKCVSL